MAESSHHIRLVGRILTHIEREYRPSYSLAVFHDLAAPIGAEKPPAIEGFRPDVYALDAPSSITIIGEAKTESDLETDHSQRQLFAFLSFLASQNHGVLLLAVPWSASAAARNLIASLCRSLNRGAPAVTVLDGVDSEC